MKVQSAMMAILLLAGCATSGSTSMKEPATPSPVSQKLPSLSEQELKGKLAIREFRFDTDNDEPKVFVQFENLLMREPLNFEVSTVFKNKDGDVVERTTWSAITMAPGSREQYFSKSMRKASASANVEIRLVKAPKEAGG